MYSDLLELTWQFQVILVAGYLGYIVGFSGQTRHHRSIDTAAITLCFGVIALFVFEQSLLHIPAGYSSRNAIASSACIVASVAAASIWRAKLRKCFQEILKWISADQDDGHATAWQTITQETGLEYSQVLVTLKDGRCLESYQMEPYSDLPNGAVTLGLDGSVALYVNAITENDIRREISTISDEDGHRITFIPAEQIVEVDLRRARK
ncbi:hypothetical protein SAMN04488030_3316 [Aliiroseovarius halocynthiae]|uniref:Uncharacterized protein n=1 Tax=Aliiroseovarius halocynthiae TaxID=985055 RepID=A0A545SN75_9RHOB|nr:hypothetical protein [Aliiroseovarius halocynthiae]TQV66419.1 hypothetical protein FIL88_13750 [Aliiroseovarius halocynthiae]SMR83399.1 hypothetical protein SAMN04488030_3316 [Aliiroseovarius halocynthiae]